MPISLVMWARWPHWGGWEIGTGTRKLRKRTGSGSSYRTRGKRLVAPGVADAGSGIPRHADEFVVHFLDPDRVVFVKVNDRSQRLAVVKTILDTRIAGQTG